MIGVEGGPFRHGAHVLSCPRCDDLLDTVRAGLSMCLRCDGLWIHRDLLAEAFGDPKWPGGRALWWRDELPCPECRADGKPTTMNARELAEVVIDRCATHGAWLDRGELARALHDAHEDLAILRSRVAIRWDPIELAERRLRRSELRAASDRAQRAYQLAVAQGRLDEAKALAGTLSADELGALADDQREVAAKTLEVAAQAARERVRALQARASAARHTRDQQDGLLRQLEVRIGELERSLVETRATLATEQSAQERIALEVIAAEGDLRTAEATLRELAAKLKSAQR